MRDNLEVSNSFVKVFTGELATKLVEAGGQASILLMYIVCSGEMAYGTNRFSFSKHRKEEIMNILGVRMGAVYKSLRKLKNIGLVEMDGLANYVVNRKYFEYGRSTEDWKKRGNADRSTWTQRPSREADGYSGELYNDLPLS